MDNHNSHDFASTGHTKLQEQDELLAQELVEWNVSDMELQERLSKDKPSNGC